MVLSMASLHALGLHDQNEVKHNFFSHGMPLVSAVLSHGANYTINSTFLLITLRKLKQSVI